jgi:hypothetical protein
VAETVHQAKKLARELEPEGALVRPKDFPRTIETLADVDQGVVERTTSTPDDE